MNCTALSAPPLQSSHTCLGRLIPLSFNVLFTTYSKICFTSPFLSRRRSSPSFLPSQNKRHQSLCLFFPPPNSARCTRHRWEESNILILRRAGKANPDRLNEAIKRAFTALFERRRIHASYLIYWSLGDGVMVTIMFLLPEHLDTSHSS